MNRKNFKRAVQPERKIEKKETEDLNDLAEKAIINAMLAEANLEDYQPEVDWEQKVKYKELENRKDCDRKELDKKRNLDAFKVAGGDSSRKRLQSIALSNKTANRKSIYVKASETEKVVEIQSSKRAANQINRINTENVEMKGVDKLYHQFTHLDKSDRKEVNKIMKVDALKVAGGDTKRNRLYIKAPESTKVEDIHSDKRTDGRMNKKDVEIGHNKSVDTFNHQSTQLDRGERKGNDKERKLDTLKVAGGDSNRRRHVKRPDTNKVGETQIDKHADNHINRINAEKVGNKGEDTFNHQLNEPDRGERKADLDKTRKSDVFKVAVGDSNRSRLKANGLNEKRGDYSINKIKTKISGNKGLDVLNNRFTQPDTADTKRKTKLNRNNAINKIYENPINAENITKRTSVMDEKQKVELKSKIQTAVLPLNAGRKENNDSKREGASNVLKRKCNFDTSKIENSTIKSIANDKLESTPSTKDSDKESTSKKKPIIKTLTSKNDMKTYKAISFVERKNPKAIQVKLPDEYKSSKTSETSAVVKKVWDSSEESIDKEVTNLAPKKVRFKKSKVKRLAKSPEPILREGSPKTEVAKWAPSCINKHTKPYYEAWVSTTLAAISKTSKKDKLFFEKQHFLECFQSALADQSETPDLVYEKLDDERYTGRITVRQR